MNWENIRYFAALAQAGSLSGAARVLGVEHATVSRRVAALEADLCLKLVDRRGRRLCLTEDGRRIAARAEEMMEDALAVRRLAEGTRTDIAGDVVISAPPGLAAKVLAPVLAGLMHRHPALRLHIHGEIRQAELGRREADIALRRSRPEVGDLTIVKLAALSFRFYASPRYLADTARENWVFVGYHEALDGAPQQRAMRDFAGDRPLAVRAGGNEIQQALARAGAGVAMLPDFAAADDPGLVPALPGQTPLYRDLWLVVHSDMKDAAPVRVVADCLRRAFGGRR